MQNTLSRPLCIGLAGLGTVGGGLVTLLQTNQAHIEQRVGRPIVLKKVLVANLHKKRTIHLPDDVELTSDPLALTDDPALDVLVEVIGGKDTAKLIISRALENGKDVVTANKALLAEEGTPLFALAQEKKRILRYEASVAGAIPIVEALKGSLSGNRILSLIGILNGTSNYILSQMTAKQLDFTTALQEAQAQGFAEADPSLDIDGFDAAHKLCLLIRLAFGVDYDFCKIPVQGIRNLQAIDIKLANELGYRIKLIGLVREAKHEVSCLECGVFPALVPAHFLLARVEGSFNAVHLQANAAGTLFFHGRGAGDLPTASAVLSDLLAVARAEKPNNTGFFAQVLPKASIVPPLDYASCYYVRLMVEDSPGVLRDIAGCLAEENISMSHVVQRQDIPGFTNTHIPLVLMTHETTEKAMQKALEHVKKAKLSREDAVAFRVLN